VLAGCETAVSLGGFVVTLSACPELVEGRKPAMRPFCIIEWTRWCQVAVMDKIKEIEELAGILKRLRNQGKKIVHCHGVFDLLHIGHIRYMSLPKIEQAKRMGDVLVVTITEDGYMDKGPLRPAFTEALRTEQEWQIRGKSKQPLTY